MTEQERLSRAYSNLKVKHGLALRELKLRQDEVSSKNVEIGKLKSIISEYEDMLGEFGIKDREKIKTILLPATNYNKSRFVSVGAHEKLKKDIGELYTRIGVVNKSNDILRAQLLKMDNQTQKA